MRVTEENGIPTIMAEFHEMENVARLIGVTLAPANPMPTVDPVPVRHIRVMQNTDGIAYQCTGCGYYFESVGRDESARAAASTAWAAHIERANK